MATSSADLHRPWLLPAALCALSAIPLIAGAARLIGLAGAAHVTPDNARFFASPLPVVAHVLGAMAFAWLGAFQFSPTFRRRHPTWHRWAGRVAVLGGLVAAPSGVWMAHFYPWPAEDGRALYLERLLFGPAMLVSLLLSFWAARGRDIARHRAWMLRAYAIGMGAGTQALLHLPWLLLFGKPSADAKALVMAAGWLINLAVVEHRLRYGQTRIIRHAAAPRSATSPTG